jgi:serine/threonine protein kinase
VIFKAEDLKLKRFVALKFLPPAFSTDPTIKQRFIHEAQAASAWQHYNICAIIKVVTNQDVLSSVCHECTSCGSENHTNMEAARIQQW